MKIFGLLAVFVTGALLISAVVDFPDFGDPESPANAGEVATHFVEKTYEETHVPNMVTAVLADYRGYDTMFETVVIFTGGVAIIAILQGLGLRRKKGMVPTPPRAEGDHHDIIIGTTCRILIPVIQLFALYVVAHGHYSPGGGFQGGGDIGGEFYFVGDCAGFGCGFGAHAGASIFSIGCRGYFDLRRVWVGGAVLGGEFFGLLGIA